MRKNRFKYLFLSTMLIMGMTACGKKDNKKDEAKSDTTVSTEASSDTSTELTTIDTEASTATTEATTQNGLNTGNGINTSGFNMNGTGFNGNSLGMNQIDPNGLNGGSNQNVTVNDEVCKAYLNVLKEHADVIKAYDFQFRDVLNGDIIPADKEPHPIAFSDVTGSGVRDLLYIYSDRAETARLSIYTFIDSDAVQIYDEYIDVQAGGAPSYCLFKVKGNNHLFLYRSYGDQNWTNSISELSFETYPFTKVHEYVIDRYYDEQTGQNEVYYRIDGADVAQNEYLVAITDIYENVNEVILYSGHLDNTELVDAVRDNGAIFMNYDNACAMLETGGASQNGNFVDPDGNNTNNNSNGNNDGIDADGKGFFEDFPTLYFSSGAGGWGSVLEIGEDGNFVGTYYDTNFGETGDDYPNGTFYICQYDGTFTDVTKIDEHTYTAKISNLKMEFDAGQEWIEDGTRYIASPPYGIETDPNAVYTIYLPGADTKSMSEDFLSWVGAPLAMNIEDIPNPFPYYGLYNPTSGTGFFGIDGE